MVYLVNERNSYGDEFDDTLNVELYRPLDWRFVGDDEGERRPSAEPSFYFPPPRLAKKFPISSPIHPSHNFFQRVTGAFNDRQSSS